MIITDDKDKIIKAYKKEQVEYTNKFIDMQEEIERLNKRIEDLSIINEEHKILNEMIRKELQQKENIIKEVRELCLMFASGRLERTNYDDILETLDKVDKENNNEQ